MHEYFVLLRFQVFFWPRVGWDYELDMGQYHWHVLTSPDQNRYIVQNDPNFDPIGLKLCGKL